MAMITIMMIMMMTHQFKDNDGHCDDGDENTTVRVMAVVADDRDDGMV